MKPHHIPAKVLPEGARLPAPEADGATNWPKGLIEIGGRRVWWTGRVAIGLLHGAGPLGRPLDRCCR